MVSVVVPTYERADVLPRALDSALAQTYSDFEVIVVDDGSTDRTPEVAADYRARDDRIRYLAHEENRGLSAARNTGIEAATGEFVTFLDSDDEFGPDLLERSLETLSDRPPEYGGTYVTYDVFRGGNRTRTLPVEPEIRSAEALDGYQVRMGGTVLRSEVFDGVGPFDESLIYVEDYEFWLRLLEKYALAGIDEPLYCYYEHGDQITDDDDELIRGLGGLLERNRELVPVEHAARFRYMRGHAYARNGRMESAATEFEKARRLAPRRVMNHYYSVAAKIHPAVFRLPLRVASVKQRLERGVFGARTDG